MLHIFVNLKRFEVPRRLGGVCAVEAPEQWIEGVVADCIARGLGEAKDTELVFLLPELLLLPAERSRRAAAAERTASLAIGCQGVFREDIRPGGNFGAFTTNRPAAAMAAAGCRWALIGHSEERKDKLGIMADYAAARGEATDEGAAAEAVGHLLNQEVRRALEGGLDVLACVGETAAERGNGTVAEQQQRVAEVLRRQVNRILQGTREFATSRRIVVAYEPVWAIGPGKVPPDGAAIGFAAACVKEAATAVLGFAPPVVYGGGLKEENAAEICAVPAIDGGLVALTRFTGEIGFYPEDLEKIMAAARRGAARAGIPQAR
jgi:triosephosphate isomerase